MSFLIYSILLRGPPKYTSGQVYDIMATMRKRLHVKTRSRIFVVNDDDKDDLHRLVRQLTRVQVNLCERQWYVYIYTTSLARVYSRGFYELDLKA